MRNYPVVIKKLNKLYGNDFLILKVIYSKQKSSNLVVTELSKTFNQF